MKKFIYLAILLFSFSGTLKAQSKFDEDRKAILALGGFYKVTFNYAETFRTDTERSRWVPRLLLRQPASSVRHVGGELQRTSDSDQRGPGSPDVVEPDRSAPVVSMAIFRRCSS